MKKILRILFFYSFVLQSAVSGRVAAQSSGSQDDFRIRLGASFQKTIVKRVKFEGLAQLRLDNNFSQYSSTILEGGVIVKPIKKTEFTLKAGYRLYQRPDVNKNRIFLDAEFNQKIKPIRCNVGVRIRGQQDFTPLKSSFKIRSRVNISYNIPKIKWEPTASVELWYNPSGEAQQFERIRLQLMLRYPIHKKINLKMGYFYQHKLNAGIKGVEHTLIVGFSFDFDKTKKKKKKDKPAAKENPAD